MSVLDDLDVSLAAENAADVLVHTRKIAAGASPEIAATDREMLIFDIAEWLWERGDKTLALDAMALALDLCSKRQGSDPVQLARRLDRLGDMLASAQHPALAADVWLRAAEVLRAVEQPFSAGRARLFCKFYTANSALAKEQRRWPSHGLDGVEMIVAVLTSEATRSLDREGSLQEMVTQGERYFRLPESMSLSTATDLAAQAEAWATDRESRGDFNAAVIGWLRAIYISRLIGPSAAADHERRVARLTNLMRKNGSSEEEIRNEIEKLNRLVDAAKDSSSPSREDFWTRVPPAASPAPAPAAKRSPIEPPLSTELPRERLETKERSSVETQRDVPAPTFESTGAPIAPADDGDYFLVPVHFATHRAIADRDNPYAAFADRPPPQKTLTFGIAHVTVPRSRELGSLPRQGWLASKAFDPDPALYITIRTIEMQDRGGFFGALRTRIGASARKEALVFIHGYNNTFTDALMRCAQLAVDLELDGAPILYSWPSRGTILGYVADREQSRNVELHRDLQAFLLDVAETTGATHIHLVGHSMGAQMLISTLDRIQETTPKPLARLFEQVVFASPDVAFDQFAAAVQRVQPLARRITVYASKKDVPLTLAGYLAGGDRTGLDASLLASVQGVASIDTTKAAEDFYAHGTFATRAIDDLQSVLWLSLDPSRRKRLVRQPAGEGVYWIYDPEAKAGPFARACTFVRQRGGLAGALAYIAKRIDELKNGAAPAAEIEQHVAVQAELDQLKGVVT